MKHISVSDFYKNKFNGKVYKITVDAGCTCPTRDGTLSKGGCKFCSSNGSGDFIPSKQLSISEQIVQAKKLVDSKFSRKAARGEDVEKKYIVYFQNFTSTYGNEDELIKKYKEAVAAENVVGIAIGTRPDCLGLKILDFLGKLADSFYVQIELGLQTSCEKTADYFNRCYKNQVYQEGVKLIHKINPEIHVVTHLIFGLPGEDFSQMMESVDFAVKSGTDGIKIACLYILKGTEIEKDYLCGKFKALEMNEYLELIKEALERIPENIVIHRLTGDGPKSLLVAPLWTGDKKRVLNLINKLMN